MRSPFIALFVVTLCLNLTSIRASEGAAVNQEPQGAESVSAYLRGAHWFGTGWVVNFWNTALLEHASADFEALRADGFNTVVLVVPWAGFASSPTSTELDPDRARRLASLIDLADTAGLDVVLRVGYAWDSSMDRSAHWLLRVWSEQDVYEGWLAYFAALWKLVEDRPRVRFAFFSWEGLWAVVSHASQPLAERQDAARRIGFQDWLREQHDLEKIAERFGTPFDAWRQVPIPRRTEPAFGLFLEFIDHAWIERFYRPARAVFPRLSMEVRIDADPVWNRPGELAYWHSHERAWDLPGAPWTTVYWAPSMGAENQEETIAPTRAAELLEFQLDRLRTVTGDRPIFISQFLVEDFTPGFESNARLARDAVPRFLELAQPLLASRTHGYALWAWRDYAHDVVASPDFYLPRLAWEGARADHAPGPYALGPGQRLQRSFARYEFHTPVGPRRAELCLAAEPDDDPSADLRVTTDEQGLAFELDVSETGQACLDLGIGRETTVTLEALAELRLIRASFSGFVQPSGIRDREGRRKPIAADWHALNQRLDRARPAPFVPFDDGWMGKSVTREIALPREDGAWALVVRTHLPDGWPFEPHLSIERGGSSLGSVPCVAGGEHRLKWPAPQSEGEFALVNVTVDRTWRPAGDQRQLGCLLLDTTIEVRH